MARTANNHSEYLQGQLLIAMPSMGDPRFERTVIYMCAHSADGAMGLVINKPLEAITFPDLLRQLGIDTPAAGQSILVHAGGPVEPGRGFVLHSDDYQHDGSMRLGDNMMLTATIDVLKAMAGGHGPQRSLLALGYAGWEPGQLDAEIQANGWLTVPGDPEIIFEAELDQKWSQAGRKVGIDLAQLSSSAGHA